MTVMAFGLFYVLLAISAVLSHGTADDAHRITIGMIADSATPLEVRGLDVNITCNVSIVWRYVNYGEIYLVYSAVRQFDVEPEVDLIVFTDYSPSLLVPENLIETQNKELIKLHRGTSEQTKELFDNLTRQYMNDSSLSDVSQSTAPTCMEYLNGSSSSVVSMGDTLRAGPPQILARLVNLQKWKSIHVFYDSSTETEVTVFVDMLSSYGVIFSLYNVDDIHDHDLHETLVRIYELSVTTKPQINIAVVCRLECLLRVINEANHFDSENQTLMTLFSRWLAIVYGYTTLAAVVLQNIARELSNVAMVVVPQFNSIPTNSITSRVRFMVADSIAISPGDMDKDSLMEIIKTGILSLDPLSTCSGYLIKTLLWTKSGRDFSDVGHAQLDTSLQLTSELFPNIKYGYSERLFVITTIPYPPFVIETYKNGTKEYNGVCMDLLHELARVLNFTYKLVDPPDNKWGGVDQTVNGTHIFNGMVGQVQRHEADIAAAPLAIIPAREQAVDFSYPVYHEYTTVVLKKPDPNVYKWRTLLDPFKINVLLSIGVALLFVTVVVFLIEKYGAFYSVPAHAATRRAQGGLHHLHDSFWYIYGALLCQGGVGLPDSFAGRTLVSAWWIFCIVIVGTYCGNLIAFLTVSKDITPFNNLEEMAAMKGEYKWGTLGGTNWEFVFTTSQLPDFRKIGDAMIEFNKSDSGIFHLSTDYHINRVKKGGYAWIGDRTTIELNMAKECDLITIKEEFIPMKYGFAFQHNSPHTAIFSDQVMKSQEAGLFEIWRRKWWPKKNFCFAGTVAMAKPISLSDVQSAHYICAVGFVIGIMAFLTEVVVFRCRRNKSGGIERSPTGVSLSQMKTDDESL